MIFICYYTIRCDDIRYWHNMIRYWYDTTRYTIRRCGTVHRPCALRYSEIPLWYCEIRVWWSDPIFPKSDVDNTTRSHRPTMIPPSIPTDTSRYIVRFLWYSADTQPTSWVHTCSKGWMVVSTWLRSYGYWRIRAWKRSVLLTILLTIRSDTGAHCRPDTCMDTQWYAQILSSRILRWYVVIHAPIHTWYSLWYWLDTDRDTDCCK